MANEKNDAIEMLKGMLILKGVPAEMAEEILDAGFGILEAARDSYDTMMEAQTAATLASYATAAATFAEIPGCAKLSQHLVERAHEIVFPQPETEEEEPEPARA